MIPKIIWQTYKSSTPPKDSIDCINSWFKKNPNYEWYYMDDLKADAFIKDHFSDEFYQMYSSLPLGVMRADVWRVAIVYVYGGIYADLDTICSCPVDTWGIEKYRLVLGVETPRGELCNFVFAAAPKHPALYNVLLKFVERYTAPDYLEVCPTVVQNFGQLAFSDGVLHYYSLTASDAGNHYNDNSLVKLEKTKFFPYDTHTFSPDPVDTTFVVHRTASIFWGNQYDSWRVRQKEMFGV